MGPTITPQVPDGALLRVPAAGSAWVEDIPPVPQGFDVTVSLSVPAATATHSDALRLLGYRVVGTAGAPPLQGVVADFLVSTELMRLHPLWWRALIAQARHLFSLELGPVLAMQEPVLRQHLSAVRPPAE